MNILEFLQNTSEIRLTNVSLIANFYEENKGRIEKHFNLDRGIIKEFGKEEYEIILVKKGTEVEKRLPLKFIPY